MPRRSRAGAAVVRRRNDWRARLLAASARWAGRSGRCADFSEAAELCGPTDSSSQVPESLVAGCAEVSPDEDLRA